MFLSIVEMKLEVTKKPNTLVIQSAICIWAIAVVLWYFYQFSPLISPLLKRLLQKDMALINAATILVLICVFSIATTSLGNFICGLLAARPFPFDSPSAFMSTQHALLRTKLS